MPGYIAETRKEFDHEMPKKRQDSLYPSFPIKYGAKHQYTEPADASPLLVHPPCLTRRERIIFKRLMEFLYLGRAVDLTILAALSSLAAQQSKPTEETRQQAQ